MQLLSNRISDKLGSIHVRVTTNMLIHDLPEFQGNPHTEVDLLAHSRRDNKGFTVAKAIVVDRENRYWFDCYEETGRRVNGE